MIYSVSLTLIKRYLCIDCQKSSLSIVYKKSLKPAPHVSLLNRCRKAKK